jgi:methylated-DNA-protein-cysteine methyltransferase related protein
MRVLDFLRLNLGLTGYPGYTADMAPRDEIADLPNLGPRSSAMLAKAGIRRRAELEELGAVQAYLRVRAAGGKPGYNLLYALHGALTGRHWNRLPSGEKLDLVRETEFAEELLGAGPSREDARRHPNYESIYAIVKRIPRGRVATYGQVATLAGLPGHARQVGYALNKLPAGRNLPWHRVLNARGQVSRRRQGESDQQERLEAEGILFDQEGRLSLKRYQWRPRKVRE